MTNNIGFSRQVIDLADALNCKPNLVRSVCQELNLDNFENVHNIKELGGIINTYHQMIKLTDKLKAHYENLPEDERQRLQVEARLLAYTEADNKIAHCLDTLSKELDSNVVHRQHIKDRNATTGGKDPRADQLAELVARIFEETNQPVTFGHRENEPTTDFCRAVKKTLEICEATLLDEGYKLHLSNWRQPAHKAFVNRRS